MTDKEFAAQKDRITKLSKEYKDVLGLHRWQINYKFERNKVEVDGETKNSSTIMSIAPLWEYKTATVTVYCLETKELEDDDLKIDFLHEMAHALVAPMAEKARRKDEEVAVTDIAIALFFMEKHGYEKGLRDGRRTIKTV